MKGLIQFVIFLFVFLFLSCKKDEVEAPPTVSNVKTIVVSEELKSYTLFLPGSYWIYKNTVDSTLDSVYVVSVETFTNSSGNSNVAFNTRLGSQGDSIKKPFYLFWILMAVKQDQTEEIHVNGIRMFSMDTTQLVNPPTNGISQNSTVGPVLIQNQNYGSCRNVKCMYRNYYAPTKTYFDHACEVIWKKHVGIIKFKQSGLSILDSWELIRYHVIQ